MKKILKFLLPSLACLWAGCVSPAADEEALLLYAKTQDLYRRGRFADAAAMLAKERKFVPSLVLRGKAEYLSGDLEAAGKTLKRALALKGFNAEAALFLARVSRETGAKQEAQKLIEQILGDNPVDVRALRLAAELARERGGAGEAASAALLDRAVEASAETALVFLDRSSQRWKSGNRAGALEDLSRAKQLIGEGSPVMRAVEKLESIIMEVSL